MNLKEVFKIYDHSKFFKFLDNLKRLFLSLQKKFDVGKEENAAGSKVRQVIQLRQGLSQDLAKQISKHIRDQYPKVRPQIQGDAVRVVAKSRNELQAVIALLKQKDYPVALQYINYRG